MEDTLIYRILGGRNLIGTLVNVATIVTGTAIGLAIKKGIPERMKDTIMQGLAMATMIIGIQMALQSKNMLIVVLSVVLGAITGELLNIEDKLGSIGSWMEGKIGNGKGEFARAFVTASLVYCVGAMAIVGSIQDGLSGDSNTLYVKSLLDGVASIVFASTMGIGVGFAAIPVLVYQGSITLLAQFLQNILTQPVIFEMTATGGVLILGIGIKILGLKDIKVGNLLPAIFYAVLLALFFPKI